MGRGLGFLQRRTSLANSTMKEDKDDDLAAILFEGIVYACLSVSAMVVMLYAFITYFWGD